MKLTSFRSIKVEEIVKSILNYAVIGLFGIMGWFFKSLQDKADKDEVERVNLEISKLRESMFKTLATREDVTKLEVKIDKLIDRELNKK